MYAHKTKITEMLHNRQFRINRFRIAGKTIALV